MSGFDALMYAAGLFMFWLGLIALTVVLFVRVDDVDEEEPLCRYVDGGFSMRCEWPNFEGPGCQEGADRCS